MIYNLFFLLFKKSEQCRAHVQNSGGLLLSIGRAGEGSNEGPRNREENERPSHLTCVASRS